MSGFAYVLMAHTDGAGLAERVRRIHELSPEARVLVRWNRRELVDDPAVRELQDTFHSDIEVRWGNWTLMAAALEALAEARRRWDPDFTVLVSGQDHPVTPLAAWEDGVRRSGTDALLRPDSGTHLYRWRRRWHTLPSTPLDRALPAIGRVSRWIPVPVRVEQVGGATFMLHHWRHDVPPVPYRKGLLWCTLSRRAVAAVLDAEATPQVRGFFASTLLPDESFVHSVVASHPELLVTPLPTSYAVFTDEHDAHPRVMTATDVAAAVGSGAPFARKVVGAGNEFARAADPVVDAAVEGRADVPSAVRRPA
ncbi:beta-1,6-N-acetylglucosaminyltransferase [Kineococcus sp. SYSU DK003]|uniref:beta-1,6-N-acetylglucosaminyltransferase n=1 Tax=Kineococcus sp. SYSU DK003 TaxID=3383124 RepID=UPI003D7C97E6